MDHETDSEVGKVAPHHKTDAERPAPPSRKTSVATAMMLAVLAGAAAGGALAMLVSPDLAVALALGGAMTFGAVVVGIFMMRGE